jgi:RNA polymerase sigma-70 factor (ECF subfamily)
MDTRFARFCKKLKPKCIQIIDLFFKGYTQQEASDELAILWEL